MGRLKVVTFKIEQDLLEQLDKYAKENKMLGSEAIRLILQNFLENQNDDEIIHKAKVVKIMKFD